MHTTNRITGIYYPAAGLRQFVAELVITANIS